MRSNYIRLIQAFCIICFIYIIVRIIRSTNPSDIKDQQLELTSRIGTSPVVVIVYYEALCPDSKYFVTKQVQNTYKKAPRVMDVKFVPYGKAKTFEIDGELSFNCQHGPNECLANMYHACTLESNAEVNTQINMVACMIRDNMDPKEAMRRCAKENNVDSEIIQKCIDSGHGKELLKIHGESTDALSPSMTFVPTITLDGSQRSQVRIRKNLFGEICSVYEESGKKPLECN